MTYRNSIPALADHPSLGTLVHPRLGNRTRAVSGSEQLHLVTRSDEPTRKLVDHRLRPTARGRRDRHPRGATIAIRISEMATFSFHHGESSVNCSLVCRYGPGDKGRRARLARSI